MRITLIHLIETEDLFKFSIDLFRTKVSLNFCWNFSAVEAFSSVKNDLSIVVIRMEKELPYLFSQFVLQVSE